MHLIRTRSTFEIVNVLLNVVPVFFRYIIFVEDCPMLAFYLARSALDAVFRIDVIDRPTAVILDKKDGTLRANLYADTAW